MNYILVAYVEDKPGVLNRVASLFRRRGYNIESLTVGHTENSEISRMTIVVNTDEFTVELLETNLYKLVNVLRVENVTNKASVIRDLALIKVSVTPENRTEVMKMAEVFRAHVVDVTNQSLMIEITGTEDKIEGLLDVLRPFGITEMVRTGIVAMTRGPVPISPKPPMVEAEAHFNEHSQY